jgi:predicted PurR-regulated permease PerM
MQSTETEEANAHHQREDAPDNTDEPASMPLPSDFRVFFQGGLFTLALLGALYLAQEIILPCVLAFVLMLVLHPAMRLLERFHLPRILSALLLIGLLFTLLVTFGTALAGPATTWAAKLPHLVYPHLRRLCATTHFDGT